jgi:hypothetical protein
MDIWVRASLFQPFLGGRLKNLLRLATVFRAVLGIFLTISF